MDEKSKNPVELLTDYLAAMTLRAMEAEKQAETWYKHWQARMAELKTAEERIAELEEKLATYMTGGAADA